MNLKAEIYLNHKKSYNLIVLFFIVVICSAIILDTKSKNYGSLIFIIATYSCWYFVVFKVIVNKLYNTSYFKLISISVFYILCLTILLCFLNYLDWLNVPLLKTEAATTSRIFGIYFVSTACVYFTALGARKVLESIEENKESELNAVGKQAAEIKALRLQINPHFLSNAHTKLNSFIRTNDIEKAIEYNTKIAALFRDNLESSTKELISLEAEFKWINNYLEVEKDLFEDLFEFSIVTNNLSTSDFLFPPMILQPLLENSIIHGFLPEWKIKKGFIKIELIELSKESYQIVLTDNGVGYPIKTEITPTHTSLSINSITKRINLLNIQNKINISLNTFSPHKDDRGTKIVLTILEKQ